MINIKILICVYEYPPYTSGTGNVAYNIAQQFNKLGHDCTICSPIGPDIKICNENIIKKIFHNRPLYYLYGILYFSYEVRKYIQKKSNKYDIIWLNSINPLVFPIKKIKCRKILLTFHSTYHGFNKGLTHVLVNKIYYKIMARLERLNLNRFNNVTLFSGVSAQTCKELEEIGINKEKIIYIPNGVDTKRFKPVTNKKFLRNKFRIPENDLIILSVGRLTEQKQPLKLIEIFSIIETEVENITLVIAGRGELLSDMKNFVKLNNIKHIKFIGYVAENDMQDLYACSNFFIISSSYEGQPLTLLEAISSGLSCIVSDIPNLRIVDYANCGLVVDFSDVENASQKIIEYIKQDNSNHAKNARKYAEENLDWEIIARKYLEELNKSEKNDYI